LPMNMFKKRWGEKVKEEKPSKWTGKKKKC